MQGSTVIDEKSKEVEAAGLELVMAVEMTKGSFLLIAGLGLWYPPDQLATNDLWRAQSPRARVFVEKRYSRFAFENHHNSEEWHVFGDVPQQVAWEIFGGKNRTRGNNIKLPYPDTLTELHLRPYDGPLDQLGACFSEFEIQGQKTLKRFVRILKKHKLHEVKRLFQMQAN